jgi:hypothetical protein
MAWRVRPACSARLSWLMPSKARAARICLPTIIGITENEYVVIDSSQNGNYQHRRIISTQRYLFH